MKLMMFAKGNGTALGLVENNAVVVTRNLRDFQRVPGLTVQDWSV